MNFTEIQKASNQQEDRYMVVVNTEINHPNWLIDLLKVEVGERLKRIRRYEVAEHEAFTSFQKEIDKERRIIMDCEKMISQLKDRG